MQICILIIDAIDPQEYADFFDSICSKYNQNPYHVLSKPRRKSTGKSQGETSAFSYHRRGFTSVKLEIESAVSPSQNRGKWTNSFEQY